MPPIKSPGTCLRSAEPHPFGGIASLSAERRMLLGASVAWCLFGSQRVFEVLSAPSAAVIRDGWVLSKGD
jgi:hypothetical protein